MMHTIEEKKVRHLYDAYHRALLGCGGERLIESLPCSVDVYFFLVRVIAANFATLCCLSKKVVGVLHGLYSTPLVTSSEVSFICSPAPHRCRLLSRYVKNSKNL